MATKTRVQLKTANNSTFPTNNAGLITAAAERAYNVDEIDSAANVVDENTFTQDNTFEGVTTFDKLIKTKKGSNLTAASTINPGTTGNYHVVTGNTTISAIQDGRAGTVLTFEFDDSPLLAHSVGLQLPGQTDIKAEPGDFAVFVAQGSGNWKCIEYTRKDGRPVSVDYYVYGTAPGPNDDLTRGFVEGSIWSDSANNYVQYLCTDATFEAAVWEAQSGEWFPTLTPDGTVWTNASLTSAIYTRSGNVVTCALEIYATIDFSLGTTAQLAITPPIASNAPKGAGSIGLRPTPTPFIGDYARLAGNVFEAQIESSVNALYTCDVFLTFVYQVN